MKHLAKQTELPELREFKAKVREDRQPSFAGMSGILKGAVHEALLREQGWICCYGNARIDRASSHLEHVRPRNRFPGDELCYANLLASCQREARSGEPLHCGKLKAGWFDELVFVSPLSPDCESRVRFTADGAIYPAQETDNAAIETRQRLGLDIPKLRRLRAGAIDAVLLDLPSLTAQDLHRLSRTLLQPDSAGVLPEFCVAVARVLRGLLP